jgi:hypothetical protein
MQPRTAAEGGGVQDDVLGRSGVKAAAPFAACVAVLAGALIASQATDSLWFLRAILTTLLLIGGLWATWFARRPRDWESWGAAAAFLVLMAYAYSVIDVLWPVHLAVLGKWGLIARPGQALSLVVWAAATGQAVLAGRETARSVAGDASVRASARPLPWQVAITLVAPLALFAAFDGAGLVAGIAVAVFFLGAVAVWPVLAFRRGHRALAWMLVAVPAGPAVLSIVFVPIVWLSG